MDKSTAEKEQAWSYITRLVRCKFESLRQELQRDLPKVEDIYGFTQKELQIYEQVLKGTKATEVDITSQGELRAVRIAEEEKRYTETCRQLREESSGARVVTENITDTVLDLSKGSKEEDSK